jgi:hypothetical protein
MQDPVSARDGHTYERSAIETWFAESNGVGRTATSPKTGDPIGRQLVPNYNLRTLIDEAKAGNTVKEEEEEEEEDEGKQSQKLAVEPALEELLVSLDLQQYLHSFADQGCDKLSDVRDVAVEELVDDVGMKVFHARRLVKHFAKGAEREGPADRHSQ